HTLILYFLTIMLRHAQICELPSFPTRRSSDLGRIGARLGDGQRQFVREAAGGRHGVKLVGQGKAVARRAEQDGLAVGWTPDGKSDRKSTRLNSSHVSISYAVFCLKKKRKVTTT